MDSQLSGNLASHDLESFAPQAPQANDPRAASAADYDEIGAASAARGAETTAVTDDHTKYTLTIPQARERFAAEQRRVPSERTLQDYCAKGIIVSTKIRTSLNGVARTEWLLNEKSLDAYIAKEPRLRIVPTAETSDPAPQAPHAANYTAADRAASAAEQGSAATAEPRTAAANFDVIGETRTLAEVLIENARILALAEGKDQVIAAKEQQIVELRDDRAFLREEIREARRNRDDVRSIASQMLETIRSMATGRLGSAPTQDPPAPSARVWQEDGKARPTESH